MNINSTFLALAVVIGLSGCATGEYARVSTPQSEVASQSSYQRIANPFFQRIRTAEQKPQKDRLAILGMQGDYRVDFNFAETVPLKAGYELHDDKTTGGYETVVVVKETDDHIVLQHILVTPSGYVVKHWRQDWFFEATERFEFVEDQTWQIVPLSEDKIEGQWTQCVYEVSDAPRYCGSGKWNHRYGVSTWTSDRTWRPLPRREYTKRDDYNAINAQNRHTVTIHGWSHEQDNTKTLRDGRDTETTLVREFGFNDYRSIDGFDFEPAVDYWARTEAYWNRVRAAWDRRLVANSMLRLKTEVDGMQIIAATFEHAENIETMDAQQQVVAIDALLDEWTEREALMTQR
ncbi:MAG: DUF6607 family protein [Pseudomonadota bacterium]